MVYRWGGKGQLRQRALPLWATASDKTTACDATTIPTLCSCGCMCA